MGKQKKATKKFKRDHLKGELERRKKVKDFKAKSGGKKAGGAHSKGGATVAQPTEGSKKLTESEKNAKNWEQMTVDDFMEDGLEEALENEESDNEDDDNEELEFDDEEDDGEEEEDRDEQEESDPEDEDELLPAEVKSHKKNLVSEVGKHKSELEALRKSDPDFFKFLKANDKDLLNFGEEEGDEDEDEDEDDLSEGEEGEGEDGEDGEDGDEDEETEQITKEDQPKKVRKPLTKELIAAWVRSIEQGSFRALRSLLIAYRAGCREHAEQSKEPNSKAKVGFQITSSAVFQSLMSATLRVVFPAFDRMTGLKETDGKRSALPSTSPHWKKAMPLVKSFFMSTLTFLNQITNASMIGFIVKQLDGGFPYLASLNRISKNFLKLLLTLWSSSDESVRVVSFLAIRKLAIAAPYPFIDLVLKGIYLYFVKASRTMNAKNLPILNFMSNCVVELYGLDFNSSYQHTFIYIRQLAIHLRNAVTTKTKESQATIYNWQYILCLKTWTAVLSTYCEKTRELENGENALHPLVYPLTQIILGTIRVNPTPKYLPLKFHCIRMLNELSEKIGVFIPVLPNLVEIFDSPVIKGKPKPSTEKRPDFSIAIKVSKSALNTQAFQDVVLDNLVELILQYFNAHALSIAFPELAVPVTVQLKRLSKKLKNFKATKNIQQLLEKVEQNRLYIERQRATVDFAPRDEQQATSFLLPEKKNASPLRSYYASMLAVKKRRLEMESQMNQERPSSKSKKSHSKKRSARDEEDDEDDEMDFDDDDEEEEEEERPKKKQKVAEKKKQPAAKAKAVTTGDGEDEDDLVEDFDSFSDDD